MPGSARWSTSFNTIRLIAFLGIFAGLSVLQPERMHAEVVVETHDVLQFDYQQSGATEEEAVRLACIRAVNATVGRVLFSDFSLQGQDILKPYIEKNWDRYVASFYVLERRFDRDGFGCRIRVQTYPEWVTRDLREKKFLYIAQPNPYYAAFITETVDGVETTGTDGRMYILQALENMGLKVQDAVIAPPGYDFAVDTNSQLAARIAAMKAGAEVAIIGRADTVLTRQEDVYFDRLLTYETRITLNLVRVNDGRVLGTVTDTIRASETDSQQARAESLRSSMSSAAQRLVAQGKGLRDNEVLSRGKFSLMFTDLTEEEINYVAKHIERKLDYGTKVYRRSHYGNVAVLNVATDRAYAALERAIIDFDAFDLRITDRQGRRVTVDVKH